VHGEVVNGSAAGFGDILGATARLRVKEGSDVADLDALLPSHFDDAMARRNRGDNGIQIAVDADLCALIASECGGAGPAIGVAARQRSYTSSLAR